MLLVTIVMLPLLICILIGQARLVVRPETISQVDERLAQFARDGIFSGSALIAQDGVVFLSQGYGLADRALGLEVIDVTVPSSPEKIGVVSGAENAWDIHIQGDIAYVGCHSTGVRILDISDSSAPEVIGRFNDNDGGEARCV